MNTQRAYNGPTKPCNLTDRNPGWRTGLPTCCRYHRNEARQAAAQAPDRTSPTKPA